MKRLCLLLLLLPFAPAAFCQAPQPAVGVQIHPVIGSEKFCLDARGGRASDGTPVFVYHCHGVDSQRWTISSSTTNEHAILGIGGLCLDVRGGSGATSNGTPVQLWKCHFQGNQKFALNPDGRIIEVGSKKCLIAMAATDEAPVVLDNCKNTPQEVFSIQP